MIAASNDDDRPGFFRSALRDDGIQRALAGVIVAVMVAGARKLIFRV